MDHQIFLSGLTFALRRVPPYRVLVVVNLYFCVLESYFREINGIEVEIEFLNDDNTRKDKHKNLTIESAGITAQQLSFLNMSIENTKKFHTFSGITGYVVSPGAWIFHKGLTFPKRTDKTKIYKDLYGICM